ncbi:MAG: hypothetical protein H7175_01810, partial [Burkholderiales bacterium]|nr:hypothetical protein [Anaerolineae bacterium]
LPTGGINNLIGIAAGSPNFDAACEYLKFIANPEWGQVWTANSRTIYAYAGSVPDAFLTENPWFQTFADELPNAVPVAAPGLEIYHTDFVRMVNDKVVEILYDDLPVEQAMQELQDEFNEFLEDME